MKKRMFLLTALLVVFSIVLSACGGGEATPAAPAAGETTEGAAAAASSGEAVTLEYWLWDSGQLPAYQKCADDFTAKNPNIKVNLTQTGWDNYWGNIQTGMVAGTAPDVFTDHLAKYPEFAAKEQLLDIQPSVDSDKVDLSAYLGQLPELWARDGKRFGLPKDWDTIGIFYNKDVLKAAGVTEEELNTMTWNPDDGGTFAEIVAKLTLDENGNNGLSPDFDKTKVKQYGFVTDGAGSAYGQTQWSWLTNTTGWTFNEGLYATSYNYADPRFIKSIQWWADMMKKGLFMPLEQSTSLGPAAIFKTGKAALSAGGSWQIGEYTKDSPVPTGIAALPQGPEGRKSMFNGLADSIWVGTKHPAEAWQWVKYLASQECADTVGTFGVVFPAQQSAVEKALEAYKAKNLDVTAFTNQALDPKGTFLFPVTDHASEIVAIMQPTMESIMLGQTDAQTALTKANDEVNALFK